ncbi:MAG: glycine--tRNA ligase subunit beta [Vampirovibrionales bacterium]
MPHSLPHPHTALVELYTEELPPAFCQSAPSALKQLIAERLNPLLNTDCSNHITVWVTPRRLALSITSLPAQPADQTLIHKGPPVRIGLDANGNPTPAAVSFAAKCNTSVEQLTQQTIGKETYLVATETVVGRPMPQVLAEVIPAALDALQGPRFMRWGDYALKFPRPILGLAALWNDQLLPMTYHHLTATNTTVGHRWHCPKALTLNHAATYESQLEVEGKVLVNSAKRRALIEQQLAEAANKLGGALIENSDLLDEVTCIVEWPFVVTGHIEDHYMTLPDHVITTVMASHQRYFSVQQHTEQNFDGGTVESTGKLRPVFLAVSNGLPAAAETIRLGNEKVLKARLNDAVFFYNADTQKTLAQRVPDLAGMTFQKGMGTMENKAKRLELLVQHLGPQYGLNASEQSLANQAALLAKADLATQLVFEFTELEGYIGRVYAEKEGLPNEVCQALQQHYWPQFQGDWLPKTPVAQTVALADKLDTLVAAMSPQKATLPTGSRDPLGLRRMANGVLLILLNHSQPFDLKAAIETVVQNLPQHDGVGTAYFMERTDRALFTATLG